MTRLTKAQLTKITRFSDQELRDCAKRELEMRKMVYPGRVRSGKMSQQKMDAEIAMMESIAYHFHYLWEQGQP